MATVTEQQVVDALKRVFDPEIPVDVWNFGLIYHVAIKDDDAVLITMTLTSEHCPAAKQLPSEVKKKVEQVAGVKECTVDVVWDPKWTVARVSKEGRETLGLDDP